MKKYMEKHPEYSYAGNGDVNQLEPINFGANNVKHEGEYRMNAVKTMFDKVVTLKEIKRLNTEKDKRTMKKIKKAIFNNMSVNDLCKKFNIKTVTKYSDVKTTENIAFFNHRCKMMNTMIHKTVKKPLTKTVIDGIDIWHGLKLQCKTHFKQKNIRTYVNNMYEIAGYSEQFVKLVDNSDKETILQIPIEKLWTIFSLPYCNTCHSVQGCSIDQPITIFDANSPYVNRYWLYTAITRTRALDQVTIFIHSDEEVKKLEFCKVKQYINNKIVGYIHQDKVAKRTIVKDNYVTFDWFIEKWKNGNTCQHCQCQMYITQDDDKHVQSNLTFDRIDNNIGHEKDNCVLCCYNCNCKKI